MYVSHERAAKAVDVFASLQDKSVEDLDAIETLLQYIEDRAMLEDMYMTALDKQQRKLEKLDVK